MNTIAALFLAFVGCIFLVGCNNEPYQMRMASRSPDGKTRAVYWYRPEFVNGSDRVEVIRAGNKRTVLHESSGDLLPNLTEFAWSANGARVYVLVCYTFTPRLIAGFDVASGARSPKMEAEGVLAQRILQRYPDAGRGDPLSWACSDDGHAAFDSLSSDSKGLSERIDAVE